MTASIAVFKKAIKTQKDTVLLNKEIFDCCKEGYDIGFRTFVLQSGEDAYFTDARLCLIVSKIKERFPNCAVTLSVENEAIIRIKTYSMQEPTDIFCVMKRQMKYIMASFIHLNLV
jgi:2-iminoacetate synthase ThiH